VALSITDTFSHVTSQPHLWDDHISSDVHSLPNAPSEILPYDGSALLYPTFLDDPDRVFAALLHNLPWEDHHITLFGKQVLEPRQSVWCHIDGTPYRYSRSERRAQPFTPLLLDVMARCETTSQATFNSVLANLYRDGSDSMGWHADDEPELGREPVIASVSVGAERRFDFRHRDSGETVSVVLPHGSLLVMSGQSQHRWVHRIARTQKATSPRLNLTFRLTLPVS
jgi:alkylated DNA repair dioxygenase AlkB